MLEGQPCLRALTAARNKMYRSNIGINLQYDIQYDSIETKQNKNPSLMNSGPERTT